VHPAFAAATLQRKAGTIFGDDRHAAFTMQRLGAAGRIFRRAGRIGGLRGDDFNGAQRTGKQHKSGFENRFHEMPPDNNFTETTLEHDPEKWKPVFPRDKRGTRLRGDHAQTKR
jgi:hypothetical protein